MVNEKMVVELKEELDKRKSEKVKAETRLEELNKQKEMLIKEIEALGMKPENLNEEIKKIEEHIDSVYNAIRGGIS